MLGPSGDCSDGFHVSLAWSLKAPSKEVQERVQKALGIKDDKIKLRDGDKVLSMAVENIKVKIGNVVNVVDISMSSNDAVEDHSACDSRKRRMS